MGTNYYIRQKGNRDLEIHVGKISCGWRFLMAGHIDDIPTDKNSSLVVAKFEDYVNLLNNHKDYYLEDEYGRECDIVDLVKEIKIRANQKKHYLNADFAYSNPYYDVIFNTDFS